jgi:hypothetical protein
LGPVGVGAIGSLGVCLAVWGTAIVDLQKRTDLLNAQRLSEAKVSEPDLNQSQEQVAELAVFHDVLTDQSRLAILIGQLHGLAEGIGLRLSASEFALPNNSDVTTSVMPTIIVTLESNASHDAIIKFVNLVLTNMPNAALDSISMKRAKLVDSVWETKLRFRFYVKAT